MGQEVDRKKFGFLWARPETHAALAPERLRGMREADAWRARRLAEIDQLISFAARQSAGGSFAKIRDSAQVVNEFEKSIHAIARKGEDVIESFAFRIYQRQERWRGKIYAGDGAIFPSDRPAGSASVGEGKVTLVPPSLAGSVRL